MSYVQLSLARLQLAMPHTADDVLIQQCLDAAEDHAAQFMNRASIIDNPTPPWRRQTDPQTASTTEDLDTVPASVVQAVLLYAADFYENRTASVGRALTKNPAAEALLHFYRLGIGV